MKTLTLNTPKAPKTPKTKHIAGSEAHADAIQKASRHNKVVACATSRRASEGTALARAIKEKKTAQALDATMGLNNAFVKNVVESIAGWKSTEEGSVNNGIIGLAAIALAKAPHTLSDVIGRAMRNETAKALTSYAENSSIQEMLVVKRFMNAVVQQGTKNAYWATVKEEGVQRRMVKANITDSLQALNADSWAEDGTTVGVKIAAEEVGTGDSPDNANERGMLSQVNGDTLNEVEFEEPVLSAAMQAEQVELLYREFFVPAELIQQALNGVFNTEDVALSYKTVALANGTYGHAETLDEAFNLMHMERDNKAQRAKDSTRVMLARAAASWA